MHKTLDMLHEKRSGLLELALKYGVENIRVFGSVARGEDRPDSDIDLLVDMTRGRDLYDFLGFKFDAEELLGRKVDLVPEQGIYHMLRDRIMREARPI